MLTISDLEKDLSDMVIDNTTDLILEVGGMKTYLFPELHEYRMPQFREPLTHFTINCANGLQKESFSCNDLPITIKTIKILEGINIDIDILTGIENLTNLEELVLDGVDFDYSAYRYYSFPTMTNIRKITLCDYYGPSLFQDYNTDETELSSTDEEHIDIWKHAEIKKQMKSDLWPIRPIMIEIKKDMYGCYDLIAEFTPVKGSTIKRAL